MSQFLFEYHTVSPTTWAYLASLLMIGLFFKFSRFWSVRNLDLFMLIMLSPGILLIYYGQLERLAWARSGDEPAATEPEVAEPETDGDHLATSPDASTSGSHQNGTDGVTLDPNEVVPSTESAPLPPQIARLEYMGYLWLLTAAALWFIRVLLDTRLTRRPLLSPNLSVGGMTFIGVALFLFLMANVIKDRQITPTSSTQELTNARLELILNFEHPKRGPGYALFDTIPDSVRKTLAILSHVAIVIGIVLVAYRHFGNFTNGIGAATLYLMMPYTSQMTGQVAHFLPAAILVWAIFCYRQPILAGILVGGAIGCIYYPLFLLPLWIGFYWHRGAIRFSIGVVLSLIVLTVALKLVPGSRDFVGDVQRMFGIFLPEMKRLEGIWNSRINGWDPIFRLPALVGAALMSLSFLLWPAQKNLATLIACSAAVMIASQFWHGFGGGLFVGWYVPFTLLVIFRPNLEDRVAQTMVRESIFLRRRA